MGRICARVTLELKNGIESRRQVTVDNQSNPEITPPILSADSVSWSPA